MIEFLSLLFVAFALVLASLFGTTVVIGPALDLAGTCAGTCCSEQACVCGGCTVVPVKWTLPVPAGWTSNNVCSNCASLNGNTYTLTALSACSWESPHTISLCPGAVGQTADPYWWHLFCGGFPNIWTLKITNASGSGIGMVSIPSGSFNCLAANTFGAGGAWFPDNNCANITVALTVTPAS